MPPTCVSMVSMAKPIMVTRIFIGSRKNPLFAGNQQQPERNHHNPVFIARYSRNRNEVKLHQQRKHYENNSGDLEDIAGFVAHGF